MSAAAGALVQLVFGLVRAHRLDQWLRLCFAMAWSYATAFNFTMGAALLAHQPLTAGLGAGMVAGASAAVFLFVRSPLTKKLMVAVPKDLLREAETQPGLASVEHQ